VADRLLQGCLLSGTFEPHFTGTFRLVLACFGPWCPLGLFGLSSGRIWLISDRLGEPAGLGQIGKLLDGVGLHGSASRSRSSAVIASKGGTKAYAPDCQHPRQQNAACGCRPVRARSAAHGWGMPSLGTLTLGRETYFDKRPNGFRPRRAVSAPLIDFSNRFRRHAQRNQRVFGCCRTTSLRFGYNLCCLNSHIRVPRATRVHQ